MSRKSTLATVSSGSLAMAARTMDWLTVNVVPVGGETMETLGRPGVGEATVTDTVVVVWLPVVSVAIAVRV